jgi:curved DNA-binding protein CbpA
MTDYYQILGVLRNADANTLKSAYRKRALESHPDRGGSHEKMLLVNEAWGVLSNPESRRRYDEFLTGAANQETVQAVEEDAKYAHERASHYPRDGSQLESWLDSILKDIVDARYGTGGAFGMPTITDSKTGEDSNSGCLFMIIGVVVAFFIAESLRGSNGNSKIPRELGLLILVGGAWLGRLVHQMVRDSNTASENSSQSTSDNTQYASTGSSHKPETEFRSKGLLDENISACPRCGAKLRIPHLQASHHVRCPKCKHEFNGT